MEFPQSVQSAFLERKAEASEGLIRLVAWPVINEQLVYLLDLQPVTQATPLPVDATASGEGQSAALPVDLMSILKGITHGIEDVRILSQSTVQLIKIVAILEHLTCCHDNTQTSDQMRELVDLMGCLSHFPELLKEDAETIIDINVAMLGSQQICKRSLQTFTQKLTHFVVFVVEQRLGEPQRFREYRASLQPRQTPLTLPSPPPTRATPSPPPWTTLTLPTPPPPITVTNTPSPPPPLTTVTPSPPPPITNTATTSSNGGNTSSIPSVLPLVSMATSPSMDCENSSDGEGSDGGEGGEEEEVATVQQIFSMREPSSRSPEVIEWSDDENQATSLNPPPATAPATTSTAAPQQPGQQLSDKKTELEQDKDKKRRATHKWDAVEIANFERGIAECGVGNWKDILVGYKFQPGRTNVDLKDKYRNMKGRNKKRHRIG